MERWLLTYADMITLLVVFFIILYAQSEVNQTKFSELAASFRRAFNNGAMIGQDASGAVVGTGGSVGQIQISQVQYIQNEMGKDVQVNGLTDVVSIGSLQEGMVITVSGELLFPSGEAQLDPAAYPVLDLIAARLRTLPNNVRINGYTDDVPIHSAAFPSNWELSTARALAVLHYFVDHGGIEPVRLAVGGYGQYQPIAPNDTRENRARNRRVEIVVLADALESGPTPSASVAATGVILTPIVPPLKK
jgi:chemotaxis protein MotB